MIRSVLAVLAVALVPASSFADDQKVLDACIASWGKSTPFKKGKAADSVIATGVKVFGLGSSQGGNDAPTDRPALVLVRPVNVMGKSTITSRIPTAGTAWAPRHCRGDPHRGPL